MATMQRLGVAHTRSRPFVSNDNPYVELAFRTLKYRPQLPIKPFENLLAARHWVTELTHWGKPRASPQRHRLRDTGTASCWLGPGPARRTLARLRTGPPGKSSVLVRTASPWAHVDVVLPNPEIPQIKERLCSISGLKQPRKISATIHVKCRAWHVCQSRIAY